MNLPNYIHIYTALCGASFSSLPTKEYTSPVTFFYYCSFCKKEHPFTINKTYLFTTESYKKKIILFLESQYNLVSQNVAVSS